MKITKYQIVVFIILLTLCCIPFIHIQNQEPMKNSNNIEKIEENEPEIQQEEKLTLYDTYSPDEIELLFGVVEAETIGCSVEVKQNVVSVIFNRIESPRFSYAVDIKSTVLAPSQFSVVANGSYKTVPITQETIDACEYVFEYGDTAKGAIFFENMQSNLHGGYATYLFNDGKHKFFIS